MNKLKVGVIGLGVMGEQHAKILSELPQVELLGVCDLDKNLATSIGENLDTKYPYVCHAEMNAILNFRGTKKDLENAKIYVDLFPCNECAKIIIQSGIKEVIYLSDKYANSDNNIASRKLFDECGVKYSKINLKEERQIEIKLK